MQKYLFFFLLLLVFFQGLEAGCRCDCDKPFNGLYVGVNIAYGVDTYTWQETRFWSGGISLTKVPFGVSEFAPGGRIGLEHTCLNGLFWAVDLGGNYLVKKLSNSVIGSFSGAPFNEINRVWRQGQFIISGELGGSLGKSAIIYGIGGLEWTTVFVEQVYKFSFSPSDTSRRDEIDVFGGLFGAGVGCALSRHIELRLEVIKAFLGSFGFPEVHGDMRDLVIISFEQLYGNLSFLYRF